MNSIGSEPLAMMPSLTDVEHLEERGVLGHAGRLVGLEATRLGRSGLTPDAQGEIHL
jgi:hypothetical protein